MPTYQAYYKAPFSNRITRLLSAKRGFIGACKHWPTGL